MSKIEASMKLEDILFKYERLTSLITILQMFVAEAADVANVPDDSLNYALFEIELEMKRTNDELSAFIARTKEDAGCY